MLFRSTWKSFLSKGDHLILREPEHDHERAAVIVYRAFITTRGSGRARNIILWLYLPYSPPKAAWANRPAFRNTGTRSTLVTNIGREGFAFLRNCAFEHILSLFRRMKSLPRDSSLTQLPPWTDLQWVKGNAVSPLPGDGNRCYTSVL